MIWVVFLERMHGSGSPPERHRVCPTHCVLRRVQSTCYPSSWEYLV